MCVWIKTMYIQVYQYKLVANLCSIWEFRGTEISGFCGFASGGVTAVSELQIPDCSHSLPPRSKIVL